MNKAVCICAFVVLSQRIYYVQSLPGEYQTKSVADTKNELVNDEDDDYYAEHDFLKYFGAVPSDAYNNNETSEGNKKIDKVNDNEEEQIDYYADHDFLKFLGEPETQPKKNQTLEDTKESALIEDTEEETKENTTAGYQKEIETQNNEDKKENVNKKSHHKESATSYATSNVNVNVNLNYRKVNVNNRHKSKYVPAIDPSHAYYQRPRYHFAYGVNDPATGDKKHHYEKRDGNEVSGQYIFVEPDGHVRTVKYKVDQNSGFKAVVLRD